MPTFEELLLKAISLSRRSVGAPLLAIEADAAVQAVVAAHDQLQGSHEELLTIVYRFVNGINDEFVPLFHSGHTMTDDEVALLEDAAAAIAQVEAGPCASP